MANAGIKVEVGDSVVHEHDAATADVGLYIGGLKVVGEQEATIADAAEATFAGGSVAWNGSSVYPSAADATAIAADITACRVKINAILDALIAHGLIAAE